MDTYKGYTLETKHPKLRERFGCVQIKIDRGSFLEMITGFPYKKNSYLGPEDARQRAKAWIDKNPVENFAPFKH